MTVEPVVTRRRPNFAEALGHVFTATVRNAGTCLALTVPFALLMGTAFAVLTALGEGAVDTPPGPGLLVDPAAALAAFAGIAAAGGTVMLGFALLYPLVAAGLAVVGIRAVDGERTSASEALACVLARGPVAVGAHVLSIVVVIGPAAGLAVLAVALAVGGAAPLAALFGLLAVGATIWPGFVYFVRFALGVPAAVEGEGGPVDALAASSALVRGGFWWVFAILALAALVGGIVGSIVSAPFGFSSGVRAGAIGQAIALVVSTSLSGVAAGVVLAVRRIPEAEQGI